MSTDKDVNDVIKTIHETCIVSVLTYLKTGQLAKMDINNYNEAYTMVYEISDVNDYEKNKKFYDYICDQNASFLNPQLQFAKLLADDELVAFASETIKKHKI